MSSKSYSLLAMGPLVVLAAAARAQTPAYTVVPVADGGTIAGVVKWEGPAAKVAPMPINKNPEACDMDGSGHRASPRLVVGKSSGVANAVVYIDAIHKGKELAARDLVLDQKGCAYVPHITIAPVKSKITLRSSDDILHNIHMFGAANYNIPFPDKNSVEKTFRKEGVVRLQCDAGHSWMSSYIHVVEHPYYAITDADGKFSLGDVPAGKYTVKLWHESWKVTNEIKKEGQIAAYEFADPIEKSQQVEVKAGSVAKVEFTLSE